MADTPAIRFDATVTTAAGRPILRLPEEASAALPSRGQVAVTGTVGGEKFQTVVEPDGLRGHWIEDDLLPEPGKNVTIEITPTKDWPEPQVPKDLQAALAEASDIQDVWTGITPMARWEWVRWVRATKNPDTRARRVEVTIDKMRSGKRRPCCFDLSSCTDPELSKSGKLIFDDA